MAKETNKEKALTALLNSSTLSDAAKACGLSEATLYRYLQEKEFKKDYREARRQLVEYSINELQQASGDAVKTLKTNLSCGNPSVEVRAAQIILDNAHKGIELMDVLERLEVLESEFEKQN